MALYCTCMQIVLSDSTLRRIASLNSSYGSNSLLPLAKQCSKLCPLVELAPICGNCHRRRCHIGRGRRARGPGLAMGACRDFRTGRVAARERACATPRLLAGLPSSASRFPLRGMAGPEGCPRGPRIRRSRPWACMRSCRCRLSLKHPDTALPPVCMCPGVKIGAAWRSTNRGTDRKTVRAYAGA